MQIETIVCEERTKTGIEFSGFRIVDGDGDTWYFLPSPKLSTKVVVLDHEQFFHAYNLIESQVLKKVRTVAFEPDV